MNANQSQKITLSFLSADYADSHGFFSFLICGNLRNLRIDEANGRLLTHLR